MSTLCHEHGVKALHSNIDTVPPLVHYDTKYDTFPRYALWASACNILYAKCNGGPKKVFAQYLLV